MANKIHNAIWDCNAEKFKSLFNQHPDSITSRDDKGRTLLSHAAERGCLEIVKFLLDQGADINSSDHSNKFSPLHNAIMGWEETDVDTVLYLVDKGANLQALDIDNRSPLDLLAYFKSRGIWNDQYEIIAGKFVEKKKKFNSIPTATALGTIKDVVHLVEPNCDQDTLLFSLKVAGKSGVRS
jgi:hypothetical protein